MKMNTKTVRPVALSRRTAPVADGLADLLDAAGVGEVPLREPGEFSCAEAAHRAKIGVQAMLRRLREAEATGTLTSRKVRGPGLRVPTTCWRRA